MYSYPDLTDQQLLPLFTTGDEMAFSELYNRYWKKLLAIAYHHTKDKMLAEEIVQEIFITLWARKSNTPIASMEGYLATAVKFSVYKFLYRQRRRTEIENGTCAKDVSFLCQQQIEARFTQEYINGLVEELPEKCRLVFRYSRNEGLSIPEISREMNIAEKTVEAHLTKGLKMLRLSLRRAGYLLLLFYS